MDEKNLSFDEFDGELMGNEHDENYDDDLGEGDELDYDEE